MLKALELVGFKSFADRTRFEFPPGITVIVGPNGSGKSNVVDGIKWVLGEQSVKSLRGKEMADVIFNGSGSRGLLNTAEATLTFVNRAGLLAIDAPEVHITRRVYRSGEGEYLINRQPCRLRDIRELFCGTGAATEAYSVIEQGKVDILLQSNPRDRRTIFEEAAGISRFKVKKVESLRRLERVDQNLLRLADIVEEVNNQLRTVRRQAGKAQRYKEHSDQLKQLRLRIGVSDWKELNARAADQRSQLAGLREAASRDSAAADALESMERQADQAILDLGSALTHVESRMSDCRESLTASETRLDHQHAQLRELESQSQTLSQRYLSLSANGDDLASQRQSTATQIEATQRERAESQQQREQVQARVDQLDRDATLLRQQSESSRGDYMNLMRRAATTSNQITVQEQLASAAAGRRERIAARLLEVENQLATQRAEHGDAQARLQLGQVQLSDRGIALSQAKEEWNRLSTQHEQLAAGLAEMRERMSATRERANVLNELEQSFEGVSAGARELLLSARDGGPGVESCVVGLVADLFQVGIEMAPLVDAALGPVAQYLVIESTVELHRLLASDAGRLKGRAGFLPCDLSAVDDRLSVDLGGRPGIRGRLSRFIETEPKLQPLLDRLLGGTWVVEELSQALDLAKIAPAAQFVTLAGEVVGHDGSVSVGPRLGVAALVSRRSELRALRQEADKIESAIKVSEVSLLALKQRIALQAGDMDARSRDQGQAQSDVAELRTQIKELENREGRWLQQQRSLQSEDSAAQGESALAEAALVELRAELTAQEGQLAESEQQIAVSAKAMERIDEERRNYFENLADHDLRLTRLDERLARLKLQVDRLDDSQEERRRVLIEHDGEHGRLSSRRVEIMLAMLHNEATSASVYLEKQSLERERVSMNVSRESLHAERTRAGDEARQLRAGVRLREEACYRLDLALREIELELAAVAGRLRDDYQLELAEIAATWDKETEAITAGGVDHGAAEEDSSREPLSREQIDAEIADLRRKINAIGSVNLDALEELNELETRHQTLAGQYQDLSEAKASLESIIVRINADSRRLLAETFETVRRHFQELFQKLFGGGHADLLLETGVDILDSGVEIVARPPGKEPRSISLLSGGEKTLTCVALLLAIFRSRPSPFCVLDEVDAALDEANIERFVAVLREFLTWTQFIIITHSKKTMTCGQTLYGVTMEESGVSKRVSVRFEDVSDTGEILPTAQPANSLDAADDATQAA